jgi:excisionase family DNA binding protein
MDSLERLRSVREVCDLLGVSRPTVQRLVTRGELPVVKLGDRSLFRPADIVALIERSRQANRADLMPPTMRGQC